MSGEGIKKRGLSYLFGLIGRCWLFFLSLYGNGSADLVLELKYLGLRFKFKFKQQSFS